MCFRVSMPSVIIHVSKNWVNTCVEIQNLQMSYIYPYWHLNKPHQLSPLPLWPSRSLPILPDQVPPSSEPCHLISRLGHSDTFAKNSKNFARASNCSPDRAKNMDRRAATYLDLNMWNPRKNQNKRLCSTCGKQSTVRTRRSARKR